MLIDRLQCCEYTAVIKQLDFECFMVKVYELGYYYADWYCDSEEEARTSWNQWLNDKDI